MRYFNTAGPIRQEALCKMNTNNIILNRFFSQSIFKNLLAEYDDETYSLIVRRYINGCAEKTNKDIIRDIYSFLAKKYRNEYFYKNTMLNKLLLRRPHNIKTTTALSELPVGNSKADFILINGIARVYEIKTELDTFERLESQLNDYYKAFSLVSVVTCESNYDVISKKLLNTPVGIWVLTRRNALLEKKKAVEDKSNLNLPEMFKILRKKEYESILKSYFASLPQVSQFKYYKACKELFCSMETEVAYRAFVGALKLRCKINIAKYDDVPYELKFLVYFFSRFSNREYLKLNDFMQKKFGG